MIGRLLLEKPRVATTAVNIAPHDREDGMQYVVYLLLQEQGAPYTIGRYQRDQGVVTGMIGKKSDRAAFQVRVAETPHVEAAGQVMQILIDHELVASTIDLSPPQVCKAPKKEKWGTFPSPSRC